MNSNLVSDAIWLVCQNAIAPYLSPPMMVSPSLLPAICSLWSHVTKGIKQLSLIIIAAASCWESCALRGCTRSSLSAIDLILADGNKVTLFGRSKRLPAWFVNYDWGVEVKYYSSTLFAESFTEGLRYYEEDVIRVLISGELQALAEYLSLVPTIYSVEEAKNLIMGLTSAQPKKVETMLGACRSITVKRLFLLLAEENGLEWMRKINLATIKLGSGARSLSRGGVYNAKYKITVPHEILTREAGAGR